MDEKDIAIQLLRMQRNQLLDQLLEIQVKYEVLLQKQPKEEENGTHGND